MTTPLHAQGVIGSLMARFAPRIEIQVSRDMFVFVHADTSISVPTRVLVGLTSAGHRAYAVGDEPERVSGSTRLELFGTQHGPSGIARTEGLQQLLCFGIMKSVGRRIMIRPVVTVTGLASLDDVLHGYQAGILLHALEAAGAQQVDFPELDRAA
jgi:hypothetical protein